MITFGEDEAREWELPGEWGAEAAWCELWLAGADEERDEREGSR